MGKSKSEDASISRRRAVANAPNKVSKDEENDTEVQFDLTDEIDEDEILEVLEYAEPGNPDDVVNYRPEEDEESEEVRELLRDPIRIVPRVKKARPRPTRVHLSETEEEEEVEIKPRSRWLITTCRYCGNIYRFRSNEQKPPTCGKPQCIEKLEAILKSI